MSPQKRTGRKRTYNEAHDAKLVEAFNEEQGATVRRLASKARKLDLEWAESSSKPGRPKTKGPSASTIWRRFFQNHKMTTIRALPHLNDTAVAERKAFAEAHEGRASVTYDLDEAFVEAGKKRRLWIAPRMENDEGVEVDQEGEQDSDDEPFSDVTAFAEAVNYNANAGSEKDEEDEDEEGDVLQPAPATAPAPTTPIRGRGGAPIHTDAAHGHPPKVLLLAVVARPDVKLRGNKPVGVNNDKDGKVLLARVRGMYRRKNNRGQHKAGDPVYTNITISGPVYRYLYLMEGGIADAIARYEKLGSAGGTARVLTVPGTMSGSTFTPDCVAAAKNGEVPPAPARQSPLVKVSPVTLQHDGAGGHGFDNRHGCKPSVVLNKLIEECKDVGIELLRQPRLSPEINMCDLVQWRALKTKVREQEYAIPAYTGANTNEVEAALWKATKEAWEKQSWRTLFVAGMEKEAVVSVIKENKGREVPQLPHLGIRKAMGLRSPASTSSR